MGAYQYGYRSRDEVELRNMPGTTQTDTLGSVFDGSSWHIYQFDR